MSKSIRINDDNHRELINIKYDMGYKTMDEVIEFLLKSCPKIGEATK